MIVRNITLASYNYNKNQLPQRQVVFQGRLLSQAKNVITYKHIAGTTTASLISNFVSILTETAPAVTNALLMLTCTSIIAQALYKKNSMQLDKHIEFKKAENIEEAKLYAKEKLGIKKFEIDDLEFANWINKALTNISNRFEGNVYFPKKIKFKDVDDAYATYQAGNNVMHIDKESILSTAELLNSIVLFLPYERYTKVNYGKGYEEFSKNLKRAYDDIDSLTIFEKFALVNTIVQIMNVETQFKKNKLDKTFTNNNQFNCIYEDEFSIVNHEVGHCFDLNSKSQLTYFLDSLKFKSKLPKLNIPMYYKSNLREFMASAFDAYMRNEEFLEECAEIFNKCAKRKKQ